MIVVFGKIVVSFSVKIMLRKTEIKPSLGFIGFGIAVTEFAYKVVAIHPLPPSLCDITRDRA